MGTKENRRSAHSVQYLNQTASMFLLITINQDLLEQNMTCSFQTSLAHNTGKSIIGVARVGRRSESASPWLNIGRAKRWLTTRIQLKAPWTGWKDARKDCDYFPESFQS